MTADLSSPPPVLVAADADATEQAQLSRLKGESLLLTASYGLTALVGVAFWVVCARTISPAKLGLSTAVISAFTAAAVVGATGVANAFLAMVPIAGRAQGALLRYGYTIVATSCFVTGAVSGLIAALTVPAIGSPLWTGVTITLISTMWGVFIIQDTVLVSLGKASWLLAENLPASLLKVSAIPILAALFGEGSHPAVVATALPAVLAVIIVSGFVIPHLVTRHQDDRDADPESDQTTVEEWMRGHRREFQTFAVRDGTASAMNLGLFMFLPFLVTAVAGSVQGVVFTLCLQMSAAMDLFTAGVGISLTTTVASDHASGPSVARVMWKRLARIVGAVALVVCVGAPALLWAFGPTYLAHGGWLCVVVLAVGALMRTTFEVWTALLRAVRRTGVLLAWTTLTSAVLLVAVIIGAGAGGAVGAALGVTGATIVSSVVGALGLTERIGTASKTRVHRAAAPGDTRLLWPWKGHDPAPMNGVQEHATWFGSSDRPLFGWLSVPDTGRAALGVVLCPPVGEESRSAHRAFRRLGSELAGRGMVALRVDYDGSGDSAGSQHDADRVRAWKSSITAAADELRSMGLSDLALVGMRVGATLAAEVAAAGRFSSVTLWDPCTTGRSFLREGHALHNLGDYHVHRRTDSGLDTPGFAYDPATVAELGSVALAGLPTEPWCDRLQVLTRTGRPVPGAAGAALAAAGAEWGEAQNQHELIGVEPNQARSPIATIEQIADWTLAGVDAAGTAPFTVPQRHEAVLTDPRTGQQVRERIVALGPNRLFGVVTEPLDARADTPWIAMVNVAIELHIGPGRRWVEYARAWAGLGLRCVRFDQSGLGDSPRRDGQREDVMFDANWLDDVPDVIDALRSHDGTDGDDASAPISLFGLCSGAYSALEAAMRRRVDAVYAVSVRITAAEMANGEVAHSAERIAARPFIRPLARLFQHNTKAAWGLWRLYYQLAVWNAPMSSVLAVLRRGTAVRILSDRKDAEGFREVLWWATVRRGSVRRAGDYELRVLPELDHALMTQWSQDITYDDATRFWIERYGASTRD